MPDAHTFARKPIADLYRWFAREAAATSPTWQAVSTWVAETPELARRLDALPGSKRQPTLFLGALKYLGAPLAPGADLLAWIDRRWTDVEAVILARATQTNEPGRCAVLAPVLASLPQPVALLEVGASAGLCLTPDRYRYRVTTVPDAAPSAAPDGSRHAVSPRSAAALTPDTVPIVSGTDAAPDAPVLDCAVAGTPPGSPADLHIAARAGLDRNPLHADDPDDAAWLRALVWPGEDARERRLAECLAAVGRRPPHLLAGDALDRLDDLLALAPSGATPVVMHSATLSYFPEPQRDAFVARVRAAGVRWLAYEGVGVLREVRQRVPDEAARPGVPHFLVALDGRPLGACGPHGGWVEWFL